MISKRRKKKGKDMGYYRDIKNPEKEIESDKFYKLDYKAITLKKITPVEFMQLLLLSSNLQQSVFLDGTDENAVNYIIRSEHYKNIPHLQKFFKEIEPGVYTSPYTNQILTVEEVTDKIHAVLA